MPLPRAVHVVLPTLQFPDTGTAFTHALAPSTPSTSTHCVHVPSIQLNFPLKPSGQVPEVQLEQLVTAMLPAAEYGVDAGHTVGLPAPSGQ